MQVDMVGSCLRFKNNQTCISNSENHIGILYITSEHLYRCNYMLNNATFIVLFFHVIKNENVKPNREMKKIT